MLHSLADKENINLAEIKFVEVWEGSETVVGGMLASIELGVSINKDATSSSNGS